MVLQLDMNKQTETFFDTDHKKCFKNAIRKKAFRSKEVKDPNNYIMYMCSNSNYDWFKAKLTKRSYKVERN